MRFRLGGNQGFGIFAKGYPTSQKIWCPQDSVTDEIKWTTNAIRSHLRYEAQTDIYNYVWKTDPSWGGQCRRLILRFADGIEHTAVFHFK